MTSFRASCEAILRGNDRGGYTVPSAALYPNQWAWDSAFAAIGWSYLDPARAWAEIRTLLAHQWPDGRVPHIVFHQGAADYFPGPDFWGTETTSAITQPPMWTVAVRRLVDRLGAPDDLADILRACDASHRFFHEQRDPRRIGAIAVVHPWESGTDNSPAWDEALERIDASNPPAFERRDTQNVGDASVRPSDTEYVRYAILVKAIANDGFGPGPFAVYDPMMTAVLARAEADLAALADAQGVTTNAAARAEALREGLQRQLWDDDAGRYRYVDAHTGEPARADVIGSYAPLFCGVPDRIADRLTSKLRRAFWPSYPLASTSPADPAFDPRRYWRGPAWVNMNWMFSPALGPELERATLDLVRRSGFREYFEPETGEGLGGPRFTWSAALALDLLHGSEQAHATSG